MCYDLLAHPDDGFTYTATTNAGKQEQRTTRLNEHDPLWMELRWVHTYLEFPIVRQV
jgi:hypothetical protein